MLFNQSYHMTDMYVDGPDALEAARRRSASTASRISARQGQAVRRLQPRRLRHRRRRCCSTSRRTGSTSSAVRRCTTGCSTTARPASYNVKFERDERSAAAPGPIVRKAYRFQVQGPNAMKVMEKVTGKPVPEVKFFNMTDFTIAGKRRARAASRHGRTAGLRAVRAVGRRRSGEGGDCRGRPGVRPAAVGARAYSSQHAGVRLDSRRRCRRSTRGEQMKAYRAVAAGQRLRSRSPRSAAASTPNNIEDYYLTPYDLGYGPFVKFDHDFIGREALEKIAEAAAAQEGHARAERRGRRARHRHDVRARRPATKYFDFPSAVYSTLPYDKVLRGRQARSACRPGAATAPTKRAMLTLAMRRRRAQRAGHRGHLRVGRRRRRLVEADGRAPRAARDPRDGGAGAVRRSGENRLPHDLTRVCASLHDLERRGRHHLLPRDTQGTAGRGDVAEDPGQLIDCVGERLRFHRRARHVEVGAVVVAAGTAPSCSADRRSAYRAATSG